MTSKLPLVRAAMTCEKVLHEKDGVLSVIRMVDTFYLAPKPVSAQEAVAVNITALISLVSGTLKGEGVVSARLRRPNGKTTDLPDKWPVLMNGNEHGANVILQLVVVEEDGLHGLYWLDVLWNGELLTSVPFKLAPPPATSQIADTPVSPSK